MLDARIVARLINLPGRPHRFDGIAQRNINGDLAAVDGGNLPLKTQAAARRPGSSVNRFMPMALIHKIAFAGAAPQSNPRQRSKRCSRENSSRPAEHSRQVIQCQCRRPATTTPNRRSVMILRPSPVTSNAVPVFVLFPEPRNTTPAYGADRKRSRQSCKSPAAADTAPRKPFASGAKSRNGVDGVLDVRRVVMRRRADG